MLDPLHEKYKMILAESRIDPLIPDRLWESLIRIIYRILVTDKNIPKDKITTGQEFHKAIDDVVYNMSPNQKHYRFISGNYYVRYKGSVGALCNILEDYFVEEDARYSYDIWLHRSVEAMFDYPAKYFVGGFNRWLKVPLEVARTTSKGSKDAGMNLDV